MNKELEKILNKSNFYLDSFGSVEDDTIPIDDAFEVLKKAFEEVDKLLREGKLC